MQSKLSYVLDQSVNNQVSKKLLEDTPLETKTDLILETTCEGIITLLRKYPEQKFKLHVFLNQAIPQPLRFLAWQLFFANAKCKQTILTIIIFMLNLKKFKNILVRKDFLNRLASDPKSCLSPMDAEISRRCESLLNNSIAFKELRDSKGNTNAMKGVLSYYHTTSKNRLNLQEAEYLYALPFVACHHPALPK